METIYKYEMPIGPGIYKIKTYKGAKILSIQYQPISFCVQMWAQVNHYNSRVINRRIGIVGTGQDMQFEFEEGTYITSVQTPDGYVWHYFDLGEF